MVDSADVIREIDRARFKPVRLREGYDMREVDGFLDVLTSAAHAGRPFAPLVALTKFTVVRLREGYSIPEVDDFLARMAPITPDPDERVAREAAAGPVVKALVARIRSGQFHPRYFKEGYAFGEVDEFLEQLVDAALEERSLLPLIGAASFKRVRFQQAYAPEDVDAFLRELAGG